MKKSLIGVGIVIVLVAVFYLGRSTKRSEPSPAITSYEQPNVQPIEPQPSIDLQPTVDPQPANDTQPSAQPTKPMKTPQKDCRADVAKYCNLEMFKNKAAFDNAVKHYSKVSSERNDYYSRNYPIYQKCQAALACD